MIDEQPIDHHYLPIFFQTPWTNNQNKIIKYSRPHKKIVWSSISPEYTGFEEHLYSLVDRFGNPNALIEKEYFSKIDSRASLVHRKILDGQLENLSPTERSYWTTFAMSLLLRNPYSLSEIEKTLNKVLIKNLSNPEDPSYLAEKGIDDPETAYDWLIERAPHVLINANKVILPELIEHDNVGNHFINMKWATLDLSAAGHTLLLGDRPLTYTKGWKNIETVISLPIAPNVLFISTNDNELKKRLLRSDPTEIVKIQNSLTVTTSVNLILANSPLHLQFIQRRFRQKHQIPLSGPLGLSQIP